MSTRKSQSIHARRAERACARMPQFRQRPVLKAVCLAFGIGLGSQAYGACTPTPTNTCLADQPIQSASNIKPNIMFILDNSGSMAWKVMSKDTGTTDSSMNGENCYKNFQYNGVYYNPNVDYKAIIPVDYLNNPMPTQTFAAASNDPFISGSGTNDLRSKNYKVYSSHPVAYPYYFKYIGSGSPGNNCAAPGDYQLVKVSATSCVVSGDVTSCPYGADERENFANWYSYYRTRINMMKSGMSIAFAALDDKFRVGFHTINSPSATNSDGGSLNVNDFAAVQKSNWYAKLWKQVPHDGTPLQAALQRVGNYYAGSAGSGLSGDPVQYSCQRNYAILATDGYWQSGWGTRGNMDKTVPSSMPIKQGESAYDASSTGLTQGATFPKPYYEGSSASSGSLADTAMYYWITDLRPSGSVSANNVPATPTDPAYWQHMTTFTIGMGVNGVLAYPADLPTSSNSINWPAPVGNTLTTVDDLWHAAVNGRGQYYKATDPKTLTNSLTAALKAIITVPTLGVGPSTSTNDYRSPDQNDYTTYEASYRVINWSGDVKKFNIDRTTGNRTSTTPVWSASKQLDLKVNPGLTSTVSPTAYTSRNIVTRTESGSVVDFKYGSLSSSQQTALCYKAAPGTGPCVPGDTSLVDYLRGDAAYEGEYGKPGKRFRLRQDAGETGYYKRDLIGSIASAGVSYVAADTHVYEDVADPGFSAFKTSTESRAKTVYAPANDGMVHAFDAANGDELWAYIPSFVIAQGNDSNGKEKGLRALSYQDGGAPPYNHHFYLDATPEVGAVDFARTGGPITGVSPSGQWRNILVGGLGKGGKGFYALDVTTQATSSSAAKTAVLWEFPSAADGSHASVISGGQMGYSYGRPIIAKSYNYGWVVLLPSGYDNADGYGYIFVLNAKTGALLETLKTPSPAPGMAHISYMASVKNNYVAQVYAGDLNGSVWRFDFGQVPLVPRVAKIFASSTTMPITSEPNISIDGNTNDRWVFFGTGRYLDVDDRATTTSQYLIALRDGDISNPKTVITVPGLSDLAMVSDTLTGATGSTAIGWKVPLTLTGERVVVSPLADVRTAVFLTLAPTTDPCSPGVQGNVFALDYGSGKTHLMTSSGTLIPSSLCDKGCAGAVIERNRKGEIVIKVTMANGEIFEKTLNTKGLLSGTRRVGYRELVTDY